MRPSEDQSEYVIVAGSPPDILKRAGKLLKRSPHITAVANVLSPQDKLIGFPPEIIDQFLKSKLFRWIIVEADGAAGRPLKAPAPHEPVIPECTDWVVGILGLGAVGKPLNSDYVFRPEIVSTISGLSEGMQIVGDTLCNILTHRQGIFQGTPVAARKIAFLNQADIPGKTKAGRSIIRCLASRKDLDLSRVVLGSTALDPPVLEYHDFNHD